MNNLKIAAISGSLRAQSFNTLALHAARTLLPDGISLEILNLNDVPLFNGDIQAKGMPESVQRLCKQIDEADGVLIGSPEYNFSITRTREPSYHRRWDDTWWSTVASPMTA